MVTLIFVEFLVNFRLSVTLLVLKKILVLQKFRWWTVVVMPFLVFYLTGLVLELDALYLVKVCLLVCVYCAAHWLSNALFDDELKNIFPLTVYLATKVRTCTSRINTQKSTLRNWHQGGLLYSTIE